MRRSVLFTACGYLLAATATVFAATSATGSTGATATTLRYQLSAAFSGGNIVHQVQLSNTGEVSKRVNITILARGSHVSSSTGNMDSYLVLMSERKDREPIAARLVHYYPDFQHGISDEVIMSHPRLRVRVSPVTYCAMDAKAFVVRRAFDPEATEKVQGNLPCMLVRQ